VGDLCTFVRGLLRCPLTAERPSFSNRSTCSAAIAFRSRSEPPDMDDGPASGILSSCRVIYSDIHALVVIVNCCLPAQAAISACPLCLGDDPCVVCYLFTAHYIYITTRRIYYPNTGGACPCAEPKTTRWMKEQSYLTCMVSLTSTL